MKLLKTTYVIPFVLFLCSLFSAHINAKADKKSSVHTFEIITMKPIADDAVTKGGNINNFNFTDEKFTNKNISPQELKCLTQIIYFEAKSEGYKGGVAVGNVVINRVKSGKFPNTICGVMNQKTRSMCQFSFVCNGQINNKIHAEQWKQSERIALDIAKGTAPKLSKGALFFHAKYAKLRIASNRYTAKIGQHYFYK